MVTTSLNSLRLSSLATLLIIAASSLQTYALDFYVDLVNCIQLDWTATLSQTEWSVTSYVELFFVSTQGARNYSLLYSALNGGVLPTPGTYNRVTYFGDTVLAGPYRIGIGLTDINGNILNTTTSNSQGTVQVTATDSRTFEFDNCASSASTSGATAASLIFTSLATPRFTSTALASATFASILPTQPTAVSSSLVPAPASTTSTSVAPVGSLSSASSTAFPPSHSVNKGAIAGGVIGGLVLLLIAFALVRWCSSRRRTRRLSLGAHRMSSLRSLSLSEKQAGSPKVDTSTSLDGNRRRTARLHMSRDTLEVAALGRLNEGSRRRSESYTLHAPRSGAHGEETSLSHVLVEGPATSEQEIRVVRVPVHITPGQQVAPARDSLALDFASFTHSATPYLPLSRTSSTRVRSLSTDNVIPIHPSEMSSHSRTRSTPLVLDPPQTAVPPQLSPIGSTFQNKPNRPSLSNSNFKIPRVSVPAYTAAEGSDETDMQLGESISRQMSRSSSTRRLSTGAGTFISVDEDPFVDAAQEMLPVPHGTRLL